VAEAIALKIRRNGRPVVFPGTGKPGGRQRRGEPLKPKLFITQQVEASAMGKLAVHFEVEVYPDPLQTVTREALLQGVRGKDYLFCRLGDEIDAEVIAANPGLKLIATMTSTGIGIDLPAATARGIPVIGRYVDPAQPGAGITGETADLTWALLMAVARRILEGDRLARAGIFPGPHSPYILGSQVHGKRLGIVGMGKVGRAIAKRAWGFDMEIDYYSTRRHPDVEAAFGARYRPFAELLRTADFVCMLPPYSKQTHHMIAERELALMKPSAFLINTSRGAIVSLPALVEALAAKKIAGAALDVLEGEPHPVLPQALIDMPNVVMTPHMGSAVAEKRELMSNDIADQIIAFLQGKKPANILNPEVLEKPARG
jgi:glyoxylate reductase